jgi:hypothetical protein
VTQPTVHARDLHRALGGSQRAHAARVRAVLDWCALHKIPATPIQTTGVPVPRAGGGFNLQTNPDQVGTADVVACVRRTIRRPYQLQLEEIHIGQLVLIEVKTGRGKRSAQQRAMQERFAAAGAICLELRDVSELEQLLH